MTVEIKQRDLKSGMIRLFLYIYKGYTKDSTTGKIKHDKQVKSLGLEIYKKPEGDEQERFNKKILSIAETKRAELYIAISNEKYNIKDTKLLASNFFLYVEKRIENNSASGIRTGILKAALKQLKTYTLKKNKKNRLQFNEITTVFIEDFKTYLLQDAIHRAHKKIKPNTATVYFSNIIYMIRKAHKDEIIVKDPTRHVKFIKTVEVKKDKLDIDDIKALKETPMDYELLKKVFLFMCYTGIRFSDAQHIKYKDILYSKKQGYSLNMIQKKTTKNVQIPLHNEAIKLIGKPNRDNYANNIFEELLYNERNNLKLQKWVYDAQVFKKITWHNARHSFGQILHDNEIDIATISALMGDTITTVIKNYVKVSDESKRKAIGNLDF